MIHQEKISLKKHNTFHIECVADSLYIIENDDDFGDLFQQKVFDRKFLIIGEGSNILFTDDFQGNVIHLATKGIEFINEDDESVYIRAKGGENWSDFVQFTIQNELYGAENLIGIPGLVGSCPVQNIGAYGAEVKDIIYQVEGLFIPDGEPFVLYNEECEFAYRDSIFKNKLKEKCLITDVVFKLSKEKHFNFNYQQLADAFTGKEPDLAAVAEKIMEIRNAKLPDINKIGCAGSFFKNPVISEAEFAALSSKFPDLVHHESKEGIKLAAGQLIDKCGWKVIRKGDVGVYPKQALVIVNWDNAKGKEVVDYYQEIIQSVKEKFNLTIEPEVRII